MRSAKPLPPQDRLRELFSYDAGTGLLTWRHRDDARKEWNTRYSGKIAGSLRPTGYIGVAVDDVGYQAHRIIWKLVHGDEPPEVDHENLVKSDNRLANLRAADHGQNTTNRVSHLGRPKGVTYHKGAGRYMAQINSGAKHIYLGLFDTPEEAHAAYRSAATELHGQFARFA